MMTMQNKSASKQKKDLARKTANEKERREKWQIGEVGEMKMRGKLVKWGRGKREANGK
jgi:hypothetical protein